MVDTQCLATIRELFMKNRVYFSALGNEDRQQLILIMLEDHDLSVGELARRTNLSRPTISHHLKVLKDAGMVAPEKRGNKTIYYVTSGNYLTSIGALISEAKKITK